MCEKFNVPEITPNQIEIEMSKEAFEGKRSAHFSNSLVSDATKAMYTAWGYKVITGTENEKPYVTISW